MRGLGFSEGKADKDKGVGAVMGVDLAEGAVVASCGRPKPALSAAAHCKVVRRCSMTVSLRGFMAAFVRWFAKVCSNNLKYQPTERAF
jgi:hypothetical protein